MRTITDPRGPTAGSSTRLTRPWAHWGKGGWGSKLAVLRDLCAVVPIPLCGFRHSPLDGGLGSRPRPAAWVDRQAQGGIPGTLEPYSGSRPFCGIVGAVAGSRHLCLEFRRTDGARPPHHDQILSVTSNHRERERVTGATISGDHDHLFLDQLSRLRRDDQANPA
jgi:hypothetical protein